MITEPSISIGPARGAAAPDELGIGATEALSLSDSLMRLDDAIEAAIGELELALDRDPASAAFRGLCVSRGDAASLLSLAPGRSFWSAPQATDACSRFALTGVTSRLATLQRRFGLDAFETDALLIAASPDLDQRYERLYGLLQDDVTRRRPTVATVVLLAAARPLRQWQGLVRFAADSALMRSRLVRIEADPAQHLSTLGSRYLVADEQAVRFLAGLDQLDAGLQAHCQVHAPAAPSEFHATWRRHAELLASLQAMPLSETLLRFVGATAWERQHLAHALASLHRVSLFCVDLSRIDTGSTAAVQEIERALLAACLRGAIAFIEGIDVVVGENGRGVHALLQSVLAGRAGPCILSGQRPEPHTPACIEVKLPSAEERSALWRAGIQQRGGSTHQADIDEVAREFQLGTDQIHIAAVECVNAQQTPRVEPMPRDLLFASARRQLALRLPRALVGIEPRARWSDLILTSDAADQLREICVHARWRSMVLDQWGFGRTSSRGRGVNVLFSGASGTGKTTACEVLANELGRTLLKIDLSQVVSKYIGESEKQLAEVFDVAERAGAVLMFDEADALFGKRTTISDAHDRYANIEVSYLLQRIEAFQGILVLTTNLQANMDAAFVRRLQFIVEFQFPDEAQREEIWRISVPRQASVDLDLDFDALAQRYPIAGGSIRNIALAAAMLAASRGEPIGMRHMAHGARREYQKIGKTFPDAHYFSSGTPQ